MNIESQYKGFGEIPHLEYPKDYKPLLTTFPGKMLKSVKEYGLPIESGAIRLEKLNQDEQLVYQFFIWHFFTNESIDNMNLVLSDIDQLGKHYMLFRGSPKVRFFLLIKTFFNEIYRIRDMLNRFFSWLYKLGEIEKKELKNIRKDVSEVFDKSVEIRNLLIHSHPIWRGREHFDMNLVLGAAETGHALVNKETGELWDIQEVLGTNTKLYFEHMKKEGVFIRSFIQDLSDTISQICRLS